MQVVHALSPIAQLRNTDPKVQIELACQIWPTCYDCILFQGFPKKWHDRATNMPSLANLLERCANDVRNWHPQRRPPLVQVRPHDRPRKLWEKRILLLQNLLANGQRAFCYDTLWHYA